MKVYSPFAPCVLGDAHSAWMDRLNWSCDRTKWTIMDQAMEMGLRIVNNRKRMRKRVRQAKRHFDPYEDYEQKEIETTEDHVTETTTMGAP